MTPKYRMWLKCAELMQRVHAINFYQETAEWIFHDLVNQKVVIEEELFENIILMQSTGLHDKNGKEIFEGDILHHPLQGMRKVYYPFLDTVASYGLENIENGMRNTLEDAHRLYEVIGNIHEHPELLNQQPRVP